MDNDDDFMAVSNAAIVVDDNNEVFDIISFRFCFLKYSNMLIGSLVTDAIIIINLLIFN